jgi:hypothetical protein
MDFEPVVTKKELKKRDKNKVVLNQANKGFDVYVLGKFIGNFQSIEEGRKGVISAYNLEGGNENLAYYSGAVSIINLNTN